MRSSAVIRIIYFILVVICVFISTYSSYKGLTSLLGQLAIFAAIVIGLVLFAADMMINDSLSRGRTIYGAFFVFLIGLSFSSISNFNYFYTNFMNETIIEESYLDSWAIYQKNMKIARGSIEDSQAYRKTQGVRDDVESELSNLKTQVLDPINPGVGPESDKIISRIERLLYDSFDQRITRIASPRVRSNEDLEPLRNWILRYETLIRQVLDNGLARDDKDVRDLAVKIRSDTENFQSNIEKLSSPVVRDSGVAREWLGEMSRSSREIEDTINLQIKDIPSVEFENISRNLGRVGEIAYSLRSAFVDIPDLAVTIMALFASLFIDLVPLLYALFLLRPGDIDPASQRYNEVTARAINRRKEQGRSLTK